MPEATPKGVKHTVAYGADDIDSIETLELSCERDESDLTAEIVSLQLATRNGENVTAAIYEEVEDIDSVGHLILSKYSTDVDAHSQIAIHKANRETFLFKGEAYIDGKPAKMLVFREKS